MRKGVNDKMRSSCINGCIEMMNKNVFNDDYLDSNSDFE